MSRRRKVILAVLLAGVAGLLSLVWGMREPRHQGRALTDWLEEYSADPSVETNRHSKAELAIRAMGAKRTLPHLLEMVQTQNGPVRSWMIQQSGRWSRFPIQFKSANETQELGAAGFYALGTNAAPAIPELVRLLNDTNCASVAMHCLISVGDPARTPVCQTLTNGSLAVRLIAVQQLWRVITDAKGYAEQIKVCLNDPDVTIRCAAVEGALAQNLPSDLAIPLLIAGLEDPSDAVSSGAARLLRKFGTNSPVVFEALTNAVASRAPSVGTAALRTLVGTAPSETLPIVVEQLRSSQASMRWRAIWLLCEYPFQSEEVQSAIERATESLDSAVSQKAKEYITKQHRELRKGQPLTPHEPSYAGKRLGEWLKDGDDGYEFSHQMQDVISQLGTNAVPALLARLVYEQPPYGLSDDRVNKQALDGFLVLGSRAKSALPKLEEIMERMDKENARRALESIVNICGRTPELIPYLVSGLTNQHAEVRGLAVFTLGEGKNTEYRLRRKQAVPILRELLKDTDEAVCISARRTLKEIDGEAIRRAGEMSRKLESKDE